MNAPVTLPPPPSDTLREIYNIAKAYQDKIDDANISCVWNETNTKSRDVKIRTRWFGFVGSYILADHLQLPWHEGLAEFSDRNNHGDVGDYGCRTRGNPHYELSISGNDKSIQILLLPVSVWKPEQAEWYRYPQMRVMGWQFPWYCRQKKWESPRQKGIFFAPNSELINMKHLGNWEWWEQYMREKVTGCP